MFKKKPVVKSLAPLRSSDRRKVADQIIQQFKIEIPTPTAATSQEQPGAPPNEAATTLTALRKSLLPDNTMSARFTTTAGPDLTLVQGTIYVGSHADDDERILWLRPEQGAGTDGRLYPTVYTLWRHPRLVPLLHTPNLVMDKLYGGADLMTPGLANGPPFPARAVKGEIVAVASLAKPSVPTFVGVCEIDVAALEQVRGVKGHAVRGVTWEGDELWNWGSIGKPGQQSPEHIDGWMGDGDAVEKGLEELTMEDGKGEVDIEGEGEEEGGVSLDADEVNEDDPIPEQQLQEPTTKEIDMAFHNAFLYCLYQHKMDNPSTPDHGMSFPIQASFLISNLITPFLPIHSAQQSQFYNIKKTSWKNVKKFIKHLDKEGLVKAKDRNGGETIILDADFEAAQLANFVPYELPKKNSSDKAAKSVSLGGDDKDLAVGQSFTVKTLYRPSGKLTPTLFPPLSNKDVNNYYTSSDVSKRLNDYLTAQDPPIISTTNPRIISLNPFISNTILSSSPDDLAILKRGTIQRDAILRRLLEDPSLCAPYHAMLKPGQTLHDVKPKAGPGPKVTVTIERRTGSKVVTKITGLEPFGAAPQLLADELQKKCSSSTSVSQAVGAANGVMSVLVQGDHRKLVEAALANRGVKSQWIDIVDKSQKKGGK
ncbi:translation machinery-associated protein [Histoplasma capsulatum var. duboisii H88]|uniref:Translation machinery-associated protein n=1 Tax=Ajellomyces capsulatus (strain H88) TaxID=544711 RepID=A0A8A1L7F0_AJEC8|nr:translation machinery-associated protein [Histoplasma capsulatum var. duboisii H88]